MATVKRKKEKRKEKIFYFEGPSPHLQLHVTSTNSSIRHKMKRAKRSGVWESFTLNKDGDEVTCNLCSQVIKYSSSTSTMKYHMSCKHAGAESTSSGSGVQQTLPSMITARRCDARKTEAITHKICRNCDGIGLMRLIALS